MRLLRVEVLVHAQLPPLERVELVTPSGLEASGHRGVLPPTAASESMHRITQHGEALGCKEKNGYPVKSGFQIGAGLSSVRLS